MTDLKVGDRVRLSTGAQGVVDVVTSCGEFNLELPDCVVPSQQLKGLGVTWEVIKPELVEPPVGSVVRFTDRNGKPILSSREPEGWDADRFSVYLTWEYILDSFSITEFELLRPEKEVVKEVLYKLQGFLNDHTYARVQKIAKEYEVEL